MKRNTVLPILSGFVILVAIVACVLPGQPVQPAPVAPGIDPNAVATAVAGTSQAALQQIEPPTSTATEEIIVPTETLPVAPPTTGRWKEEQPDGTTLYADYDLGYQITFPPDWAVILSDQDDLTELFSNSPNQQEKVANLIATSKIVDVNNIIRVYGVNLKAEEDGYPPNVNIAYDINLLHAQMSMKDYFNGLVQFYQSRGIRVVSHKLKTNSSGMEVGIMEMESSLNTLSGQKINLQQKQVCFKPIRGTVLITFSTTKEATIDLSDEIDILIESIHQLD